MIETTTQLVAGIGETVLLRLEGQGVGGYVWSIGQLPPGLASGGEAKQDSVPDVGSGAVLVIAIRGLEKGRHSVICERQRQWGNRDVAERLHVIVEVR